MNQQGSQVIQGTLLVIPIEESLIYIRPLYLRASGGQIPELNRVIVAHQDRIVMAETLAEALDRIFPADGSTPPTTSVDAAAVRAADLLLANAQTAGTAAAPGQTPASATGATPVPGASGTPALPASPQPTAGPQTTDALVQQAEAAYRRAMDAQRAGDWAAYGEQIKLLGRTLTELRDAERRRQTRP